jgi:methionyl aminopeptidase
MLFEARPAVQLKSREEIEGMRRAGRLAARCLQELIEATRPGITTEDLHEMQMAFARTHGVKPAPLNYKGFPKSVCTSVNEVICHGIPSRKHVLREGDIIGIDVTLIVDGFYGDNAATVPVGQVSDATNRLLHATLESLRLAVLAATKENRLGDIGHAIQSFAERNGYSVVRDFVGHGIGRQFHEPPQVSHVGTPGRGQRLRPGMTFTIEPMINEGVWQCRVLRDGWTAVTADGRLSAQFEHTLAIGEDGPILLTVQNDDGAWEPPGRTELAPLAEPLL